MKPDRMEDSTIKEYYSLRASEYDLLYERKERQEDLRGMEDIVLSALSGKRVLEIACGTGYWTELLAEKVESIHCIDTSEEMLRIAKKRVSGKSNVTFSVNDAYSLEDISNSFNAAFLGYWISHVPRAMMKGFMASVSTKLEKCSLVVLLDNTYVDGSSTPISRTDEIGNTYQLRKLSDGRKFEIIKNFMTEHDLRNIVPEGAYDLCYYQFQFYWVFHYRIRPP